MTHLLAPRRLQAAPKHVSPFHRWSAGWLGAACLWSSSAIAQGQASPSSSACSIAPPASSQTPAEQVRSLYAQFECHFSRREYGACLPFLEQACLLTDSPRCLLNLGVVHHALMHCQLASGYYEEYLARSPYDEEAGDARHALEELHRACPDRAPPPLAVEATTPRDAASDPGVVPAVPAASAAAAAPGVELGPSPRRQAPAQPPSTPVVLRDEGTAKPERDRALTWSLLGLGAASLTATLIAASYGLRAEKDFEALDQQNGALGRGDDPRLRAIDRRGHVYNELAVAFGSASGLLLGAGAALWIFDLELAPDASLTVSGDGSASVSYELAF